jgi:peptidoglycan/xylan/chitin deacetylase (PgdA/CDA1 family)
MSRNSAPYFTISLDFELMWGVRDKLSSASYRPNILGVREAIPAMLQLFRKYDVRATWAAVGLLLFDNKKDMLNHLPAVRPTYVDRRLSPYSNGYLEQIGDSEKSDPYHYGFSLARQIVDCDGMELGSHTFSHYYCLERGQSEVQFRADLEASVIATKRLAPAPVSLVFPRNQYNAGYLPTCAQLGFTSYRGNESGWAYRESTGREQSALRRGCRLADAYLNLTGHHGSVARESCGVVDVPASRFLRPYRSAFRAIEPLRARRIRVAMTSAVQRGYGYHLWWHPHNFGRNLPENLAMLATILRHVADLREKYGLRSMTMGEVALRRTETAAE